MLRFLVNAILKHGYSADEIRREVDRAVEWIEAHPTATQYLD
jgi:hypothetical protein